MERRQSARIERHVQKKSSASPPRCRRTRATSAATHARGAAACASGHSARIRSSVAAADSSGSRNRTTPRLLHAIAQCPIGVSNTANDTRAVLDFMRG